MNDVPLPTDAEQDAIDFAIDVNADHYRDIDEPEKAEQLEDAREAIIDEGYIPGEVVDLVWDILMEHNHFKIASAPDYNDGADRKPLIDAVYHIVIFNGDELYEDYERYRDQFDLPTDAA